MCKRTLSAGTLVVVLLMAGRPLSAEEQCWTRIWSAPEKVTSTLERSDEPPYQFVRTADDSLRMVWCEDRVGYGWYRLVWAAREGDSWGPVRRLFPDEPGSDDNPHLSTGDDGTIAMTWVRHSRGAREGDLMLSLLHPGSLVWTSSRVIRSPVAWGIHPLVATVTADSLWVFFNRGIRLRAKPVVNGVPGDEYIFDNDDDGAYAWSPDLVRASDGTIWVFWTPGYNEDPVFRAHYLTLSETGFSTPTAMGGESSAHDVDALEDTEGKVWIAYQSIDPFPPGTGGAAAKARYWTGSEWSEEFWIAGDEGVKRNCQFTRLASSPSGTLHAVYGCEVEEADGGFSGMQWELYHTTWQDPGWCPREGLDLPPLPEFWHRSFQEVTFDSAGRPLVAYGYGPGPTYTLYTTDVLRSVDVRQAWVQLSISTAGYALVEFGGGPRTAAQVVQLQGKDSEHEPWKEIASRTAPDATDRLEFEILPPVAWLRATLSDLSSGARLAESAPLQLLSDISAMPITIASTGARRVTFSRKPGSLPRPLVLEIYDVAGRRVAAIDEFRSPSANRVEWDGTDRRQRRIASGVYMVRIREVGNSRRRVFSTRVILAN